MIFQICQDFPNSSKIFNEFKSLAFLMCFILYVNISVNTFLLNRKFCFLGKDMYLSSIDSRICLRSSLRNPFFRPFQDQFQLLGCQKKCYERGYHILFKFEKVIQIMKFSILVSKFIKISNIRLKCSFFNPIWGHFHYQNQKTRIFSLGHTSNIFHLSLFEILGVYLIKKQDCHTQAFFLYFSPFRGTVLI